MKRGCIGVTWAGSVEKWAVRISVDRKQLAVGYYSDFEEAERVYASAVRLRDVGGLRHEKTAKQRRAAIQAFVDSDGFTFEQLRSAFIALESAFRAYEASLAV